jgi:hypothetical protein
MAKRWEYKIVTPAPLHLDVTYDLYPFGHPDDEGDEVTDIELWETELQKLGEEGWELIAFLYPPVNLGNAADAYFKRELS